MHHIIYMSQAVLPLSEQDLTTLLQHARYSNEQQQITGALLYQYGRFLQLMEGEEADVVALYERIVRDSRHKAIIKLADKSIPHRSFADWAMAFPISAPALVTHIPGYQTPEQVRFTAPSLSQTDTDLLQLLQTLVASDTP